MPPLGSLGAQAAQLLCKPAMLADSHTGAPRARPPAPDRRAGALCLQALRSFQRRKRAHPGWIPPAPAGARTHRALLCCVCSFCPAGSPVLCNARQGAALPFPQTPFLSPARASSRRKCSAPTHANAVTNHLGQGKGLFRRVPTGNIWPRWAKCAHPLAASRCRRFDSGQGLRAAACRGRRRAPLRAARPNGDRT